MPRASASPARNPTYPIILRAVINNPLTLAYTDEPVGIRVRFNRGEVPTADYLRVRNNAGTAISFQWDPSVNPLNDTSRGAWRDGSLREGTIWVNVPSLAPLAEIVYTVEIHSAALSQSFTQLVTYTQVGAVTDERFDTARIQVDFNSGKQWMPARYRDKNASSDNLFNGTQGCFSQYQTTSGTTRNSYTSADVASNVRARRGTTNFGYGVCFQEIEISWTWNPETTVAVRERFRIWANGSLTRETYHYTTGSVASTAKRMSANVQPENTGMTGTNDAARVYKEFVWSTKRMIAGARTITFQYPALTTETHSTAIDGTTNNNQIYWGWQGTTTLPSGAFWYILSFYDLAYAAGDGLNQWTRRMNPLYTWATRYSVESLRNQFTSYARDLIADWIPLSAADATDAYTGAEGLAQLTLAALDGTDATAAALANYQEWAATRSITPATAASYDTAWDGGLGWEFIGKNIEVLPWLRYAFLANGDTTNAALVATYIHAAADGTVMMEITSGGGGQMKLDGGGTDNFNAEASALSALAASLEIEANATRQACYERIAARYVTGYFAQTKMPYNVATAGQPSDVIKAARSTYYSYQGFHQWLAHAMKPLPARPQSMRQYVYEYTTPSGIADEWRYQLQQTRRGLPNTMMYPMLALALDRGHESDWQWIAAEMEYLHLKRRPGRWIQNQLESLTGTDVTDLNAGVDVRALCEIILRTVSA